MNNGLVSDDSAAEFEARARILADNGQVDDALEALQAAIDRDPQSISAATFACELLHGLGQPEVAINLMQELALRNPGQLWPFALISQVCANMLEDAGDPTAAHLIEEGRQITKVQDEAVALDTVRKLLRRLGLWQELARHLDFQIQLSVKIMEQIELHDELAEVLASKLSDPLAARDARNRAIEFRDVPNLVASYWKNIEEHADDPLAWNEAEAFFRANELWGDLAVLLENSIEGSSVEDAIQTFDDLFRVYEEIPDPRWSKLLESMDAALPRATPAQAERLKAQRARVLQESDEHRKTKFQPLKLTSWPPALLFAVAMTLGVALMVLTLSLTGRI